MKRATYIVILALVLALIALAGCHSEETAPVPIEPKAVRERGAFDARDDSYVYNGADIRLYTDDHSTESGRLDAAGGWQVAAPTAIATATPALLVKNSGVSQIASFQDGTTEIVGVRDGGGLVVTGPTAVATAQAALVVDSAGVSQIASFQDGSTEVLGIIDGGQVKVAAPTAIATASPALIVDSAGVSNLIEVRDAATPVFTVNDGGVVVGNVLLYGSSGERAVSSTESITGTATVSHGLTTVTWALCILGEDPTAGAGEAAHVTVAVSGNTVTAKVWQDDFVTAATETDVDVHCLVIGTP